MENLITRKETFMTRNVFRKFLSNLNATGNMPIKRAVLAVESLALCIHFSKFEMVIEEDEAQFGAYENIDDDIAMHPDTIISLIKELAAYYKLSETDNIARLAVAIKTDILKFKLTSIFAGDEMVAQNCSAFTEDVNIITSKPVVQPLTTQKVDNYQVVISTSANMESYKETNVNVDVKVDQLFGHIQHAHATVDFNIPHYSTTSTTVNVHENPELLESIGIVKYSFN